MKKPATGIISLAIILELVVELSDVKTALLDKRERLQLRFS